MHVFLNLVPPIHLTFVTIMSSKAEGNKRTDGQRIQVKDGLVSPQFQLVPENVDLAFHTNPRNPRVT